LNRVLLSDVESFTTFVQARLKTQAICYRLISQAKQRLQSEAGDAAENGSSKSVTNGDSNKAAMSGETGTPAASEQPSRRRAGALPPGGFISHLLSTDNKLIGRKFTDFEVTKQIFN